MRVLVRLDSSARLGMGHLMRCITLANQLRQGGAYVAFACRALAGNMNEMIRRLGYQLFVLRGEDLRTRAEQRLPDWEDDAAQLKDVCGFLGRLDWVIVDHYGLDAKWERDVKTKARRLMVVDDLANRPHECELLLDQNHCCDVNRRYAELVPETCKKLIGTSYALLRPEFSAARAQLRPRNGRVRRLLVFYGGADQTNETSKALRAVVSLGHRNIGVDVVFGQLGEEWKEVERIGRLVGDCSVYSHFSQMADLMTRCDLAIGGAGSATWERCALGLPAIVSSVAENQIGIAHAVANEGAITYLGPAKEVSEQRIAEELESLLNKPDILRSMSSAGVRLVDGLGSTRVLEAMVQVR